jgi:hypothetical protein
VKYRQHGYQDDDYKDERPRREDREPRRDPELPGGRLSAPQRAIRVLRCHRCGNSLPLEQDARGDIVPIKRDAACNTCASAIHACRNCQHFDPNAHFECRKPVKARLKKDVANDCELYEPKVTVEMTRDELRPEGGSFALPTAAAEDSPRHRADARRAFEDLFKSPRK